MFLVILNSIIDAKPKIDITNVLLFFISYFT